MIWNDPHYQRQKDSTGSVDLSDVQVVHKFARRVTPDLDFKVTVFFNVKYLENVTRYSCTSNGRLIGSRI